ncbi:MAG: dipeptide epimerase [Pseudomonadota bacterium]
MAKIKLTVAVETLRLAEPFRISGYVFESQDVVVATLDDGKYVGRGEGGGIYYLGDTAPEMTAAIASVRTEIEAGADREVLQKLLRPCGGRNALDCAFWDLEAKRAGTPVWKLAGMPASKPLRTTFTIGADDPGMMASKAISFGGARSIKLKLTGDLALDSERVKAVRAARPDVWIAVDANQGYARANLEALVQVLTDAKVSLLEQPLARGREADLDGYKSAIPIAADESALSLADVAGLVGRFDVVNIKLDKCGGLTEGLAMAREARRLGLDVMVGNMVGTSLAMAPAFVLGQLCDVVDLDGPIFLARDRSPGVVYAAGLVSCGDDVWGSPLAVAA